MGGQGVTDTATRPVTRQDLKEFFEVFLEGRFNQLEGRFNQVDTKLDNLASQIGELDIRVAAVESRMTEVEKVVNHVAKQRGVQGTPQIGTTRRSSHMGMAAKAAPE